MEFRQWNGFPQSKEIAMSRRLWFLFAWITGLALFFSSPTLWAQEDDYDAEGDEYDEYDDYDGYVDDEGGDDDDEEGFVDDEEYEDDEGYEDDEEYEDDGDEDGSDDGARLAHPSFNGSTGLFHVMSATSGDMLTFSTGFHANFFLVDDWLLDGDENSFVGGTAHLRLTAWHYIETYLAVTNYAHSNPKENPQLFQTLGDFILGVKGFYPVLDWLHVGGSVGVHFLNQVGDVAFAGGGTSVAINAVSTFDFQALNSRVPLRLHLNAGYFFDNSASLVEKVEQQRARITSGNGCSTDLDGDGAPDDDAGCITRIERTALHISRVDTVWLRLGLEAPLPYVTPIVEYNVGIPANRQGFNCVWRADVSGLGSSGSEFDSCYDVERSAAMPMWLTVGARVEPWVRGLAINLAADIGLTGTKTFVHELPATPPYMIYLGLSYSYDPRSRVIERVREVEVEVGGPEGPVIVGRAISAENQQGIARVIVTWPGRDLGPLATKEDGSFRSWPMEPGEVTVHMEHPDYEATDCTVTVPAEADEEPADDGDAESEPEEELPAEIPLECTMTPVARAGTLGGRVTEEEGGPIAGARVTMVGPEGNELTAQTDGSGAFEQEVPPGAYTVRVEADNYLRRGGHSVEVQARQRTVVDMQLRRQPDQAMVRIQGDQIRILRPVHFRTGSAEIDPDSNALLEQVADMILRNPEICRLEVQGHTDSRGTRSLNTELSNNRAQAVLGFLVRTGVTSDRLASRGYGPDRPVGPNITAAGRRRNRRVEFHILERCTGQ
jgi:outer membrane protein OmpA-like peptidoglycan-associated protein